MSPIARLVPAAAGATRFQFQKDARFLDNQAGAAIRIDAAVAQALVANTRFPAGMLRLGAIAASLDGRVDDIRFGGGQNGAVSFNASGGAPAGLGVYSMPPEMLADLGGDAQLLQGIASRQRGRAPASPQRASPPGNHS